MAFVTPVSASPATDDLSIDAGIKPIVNAHYDFNELVFPEVLISNELTSNSDSRQIMAAICPGDRTATMTCPTGSGTTDSLSQVPNLGPKESVTITFNTLFFFASSPGVHTVVFWFPATDIDETDDRVAYTFDYDQPLRDLIVNGHDVDTSVIYNSGVPIPANLDLRARSWLDGLNFTTGWTMHLIEPLVAEAEDCLEWQKNFTGVGDEFGNEIILHDVTHDDVSETIHYAPYDMRMNLSNDSVWIHADIDVLGSEYGQPHSVEIVAINNGTELFTTWFNFTGDGTPQNQRVSQSIAGIDNGTTCFSARMTVPDIQVASDSMDVGGISGSFNSQPLALPNITAPYAGEFEVRASISNTFIDPNPHNDQVSFDIIVDDTVNAWIREVVPARGTTTYVDVNGNTVVRFPYGDDSIRIVSGNIGWKPVQALVEVNILEFHSRDLAAGPYTCNISLLPGEEIRCDFDFASTGLYILNASIVMTDGGIDVDTSDNWYEVGITVDFGLINPVIANPGPNAIYETGDTILAVAGVNPLAPMPLNFTWKLNYVEVLGYGQTANITMPMGEWLLTLYVTDEADNLEIAAQSVRILNRVEFAAAPHIMSGVAVSTAPMELTFDTPELPPTGILYPTAFNKGKDPLVMFNASMRSTLGVPIEVDVFEAWLDLAAFLPPAINASTVEILRMPTWGGLILEEFDLNEHSEIYENGTLYFRVEGDAGGAFMLIGALDPVVVNPGSLDIVLQKDGQVKVVWDNEGDTENPYFGGWRLYRKTTLTFSYPFNSQSQFNSATLGYHVLDLAPGTEEWQDPNFYEDGTCLSFLVMSHSRGGVADWHYGNVTRGTWNEITQRMDVPEICVDDLSPSTEVIGMRGKVIFDNATKKHSTNISWTWPPVGDEGPLTWSLYRAQSTVSTVEFMEPLVSGLVAVPGEKAWYGETESALRESVHLEQFYYYVLIPFDAVENSDFLVRSNNAVGLTLDDQFWDYHLPPPPPPEPAPPEVPFYGPSPWYGRLLDDMEKGGFQQAGLAAAGVVLMNLFLIPLMINKLRVKKRKVRRMKARQAHQQGMLDADEFADDFDEFFD